MAEDDDRQDALIEQHAASIEELNARIAALENSLKHNGLKILVLIISILALILSLLQVFKIL